MKIFDFNSMQDITNNYEELRKGHIGIQLNDPPHPRAKDNTGNVTCTCPSVNCKMHHHYYGRNSSIDTRTMKYPLSPKDCYQEPAKFGENSSIVDQQLQSGKYIHNIQTGEFTEGELTPFGKFIKDQIERIRIREDVKTFPAQEPYFKKFDGDTIKDHIDKYQKSPFFEKPKYPVEQTTEEMFKKLQEQLNPSHYVPEELPFFHFEYKTLEGWKKGKTRDLVWVNEQAKAGKLRVPKLTIDQILELNDGWENAPNLGYPTLVKSKRYILTLNDHCFLSITELRQGQIFKSKCDTINDFIQLMRILKLQ